MLKIKRILVPFDWSEISKRAIQVAASLAKGHDAEIVVLYAVPVALEAYGPLTKEYLDHLQDKLRNINLLDSQIRVQYRLLEGAPAAVIVDTAKDAECELIVMGTHGRTGLNRLFRGSVAEEVMCRAPCMVMTVRNDNALPCEVSETRVVASGCSSGPPAMAKVKTS
jgi:nucleotide-binding universal stress UspA family protein